MIRPIVAYGDPILRKIAQDIDQNYPDLKQLIADMYDTMYNAHGVGLAAPQIGLSVRLFVVDGEPFDPENLKDFKKVFINAQIIEESQEEVNFNEGCLSIPDVRGDVLRPNWIKMSYLDEKMRPIEAAFEGLAARIIQHEYDHIDGILFTDHLSSLTRTRLQKPLRNIQQGSCNPDYKMRFYNPKHKK